LAKAEAMAARAIELDRDLAEPHATLGFIRMFLAMDWTDAEREFKRAIELNPRYPPPISGMQSGLRLIRGGMGEGRMTRASSLIHHRSR